MQKMPFRVNYEVAIETRCRPRRYYFTLCHFILNIDLLNNKVCWNVTETKLFAEDNRSRI